MKHLLITIIYISLLSCNSNDILQKEKKYYVEYQLVKIDNFYGNTDTVRSSMRDTITCLNDSIAHTKAYDHSVFYNLFYERETKKYPILTLQIITGYKVYSENWDYVPYMLNDSVRKKIKQDVISSMNTIDSENMKREMTDTVIKI